MSRNEFDINDDNMRVIRPKSTPSSTPKSQSKRWWIGMLVLLCACTVSVTILFKRVHHIPQDEIGIFDLTIELNPQNTDDAIQKLGDYNISQTYTEHLRDTINDVVLNIYIPHNAEPELILGLPDIQGTSIIMATQAADIRADNDMEEIKEHLYIRANHYHGESLKKDSAESFMAISR